MAEPEPEPEPTPRKRERARRRKWIKPPAPPPAPGSREALKAARALARLRAADPALAERVEKGEVTLTTAMRRAGLWAYPSPPKSKPAPRMSTEWPEAVDATQAALLAIEDRLDGDEAALVDLGTRERLIARRRELASELERMKTQALSGAAPSAEQRRRFGTDP